MLVSIRRMNFYRVPLEYSTGPSEPNPKAEEDEGVDVGEAVVGVGVEVEEAVASRICRLLEKSVHCCSHEDPL